MNPKYNILIFITLSILFFACNNDETCRKVRYVGMNVTFYTDTINIKTDDTVQVAQSFDSIRAHGIKSDLIDIDSIIKSSGKTIQLPLNQLNPTSKFAIKCNKSLFDTLTVYYTNNYQYLSLECGTIRVHHLDSVLTKKSYFYKVKIENPEVDATTSSSSVVNISLHHLKQ